MPHMRISDAAELLGVSDDTVRRMADSGRLDTAKDNAGRLTVSGKDLAALAREIANPAPVGAVNEESARNRMRGIVTRVVKDTVMAQVEMQAGPPSRWPIDWCSSRPADWSRREPRKR